MGGVLRKTEREARRLDVKLGVRSGDVPELPLPKPEPLLVVEEAGAEEAERRRLQRRRGREETFLTGELIPKTTKKKVFG